MEFIIVIVVVAGVGFTALFAFFAYKMGYGKGWDDRSEDLERRHAQDKAFFAKDMQ